MTLIYIVRPRGRDRPCKVGISQDPKKRLCEMQTGSPDPLELVAVIRPVMGPRGGLFKDAKNLDAARVEADVHRHLRKWRVHGEWFDVDARAARIAVQNALLQRARGRRLAPATGDQPRLIRVHAGSVYFDQIEELAA